MELSFGGAVSIIPANRKTGDRPGHMEEKDKTPQTHRRDFFKKSLALAFGGTAAAVPIAAGLMVTFDPLRRNFAGVGGAVYLRRTKDDKITALNVLCPHAGCFVDYMPGKGNYLCPCHVSSFTIEGKIDSPGSPSPRGLDELEVQVRNTEVWVVFQNFQAGRPEKVPVT